MKVVMIHGSANDQGFMKPGRDCMDEQKLAYSEHVLSAHRNVPELIDFLGEPDKSSEKIVILAIAGLSAALPGVVAVTKFPVVCVPVPGGPLNGIDALLSICQVPGRVPLSLREGLNQCITWPIIGTLSVRKNSRRDWQAGCRHFRR